MEPFLSPAFAHFDDPGQFSLLTDGLRWQLDADGLAVVENVIDPDYLARMQASIGELKPRCYSSGAYKALIGSDLTETLFDPIANSKFLLQISNALLARWDVRIAPTDIYGVLNILEGQAAQAAINYHFDATFLTMSVPIVMPETEDLALCGRFRIWPNVRTFSQNKLKNASYWRLMRYPHARKRIRNFAVKLVPGNAYFFYGFRSYHGTDPLDPRQLRANLLVNVGGPLFQSERGERRSYRARPVSRYSHAFARP